MNPKGVIILPSPYTVSETIGRIQIFLEAHGATIYARIDQQSEVSKAGLQMPPLEFIMFGNPKADGPIMTENPVAALDLPLKIIAWQDFENKVWLAFNDAAFIEERYALSHNPDSPLNLTNLVANALK
jgi:uncharacterized protein (DUF302 family)